MSQFESVLVRYRAACENLSGGDAYQGCATTFATLLDELEAGAVAGDEYCQDAIATILGYGLHYTPSEGSVLERERDRERATHFWIAAAKQGLWGSFDNLVTQGVGPVADQAREIWKQVEAEQPELVGYSQGMPVYGPPFVQKACERFTKL
jgi:hypothetical protein